MWVIGDCFEEGSRRCNSNCSVANNSIYSIGVGKTGYWGTRLLFLLFIQASSTGTERTAMEYLLGNCTCRQIQSANWTAPGHLLSPETLPQTSPVVPLHFYFYFFFWRWSSDRCYDVVFTCKLSTRNDDHGYYGLLFCNWIRQIISTFDIAPASWFTIRENDKTTRENDKTTRNDKH